VTSFNKQLTVVVALSGGIDSAVAAALLKEEGLRVIGVYLHFWSESRTSRFAPVQDEPHLTLQNPALNKCCSLESLARARQVAGKLKIPLYALDASTSFKTKVVDNFLQECAHCRTPNPCVRCNQYIKFGELLKYARSLRAQKIATGHYARNLYNSALKQFELWRGKDVDKDQSYFLYRLNQSQLKHTLFPLGDLTKTQVKKLAQKYQLDKLVAQKLEFYQESQGLCFFPEKEPARFLKRNLSRNTIRPGPIFNENNILVGSHQGLQFYTIGQRKGIRLGGLQEPLYVLKLDYQKNTLLVGLEKELWQTDFKLNQAHFICPLEKRVFGKTTLYSLICTRYHQKPQQGFLNCLNGYYKVHLQNPLRAIAPGQSAVFYENDRVIGGGIIER